MKALEITVSGKVQGVWFRARTKETAEHLNIKGYVMNRPDGTVFVRAEGDENNMDAFLKWLGHGPELARVDSVVTKETDPEGFADFTIRR